ncbi:zinc-ribbon and DUF3426 domain-containing protein [Psychrobacter sp. F1192]|uniref:Zinc-ribbon and DUF3426 domain-containing protein n=1 Tax=Psychrobacter coccoides TaxID=2818440 RepID=A0ABS3NKN3_9GAMM|nr:zinc-ribbon and DUF3426 domain-containing protein [Psychrobacter coccoides]MBO1529977.1 zinc-ribbon and DUF3426 domain-containing protein [Psychrobacter coccoides]
MSSLLNAQCPSCQTCFSVAPAQLKQVKARCGHCQHVFLIHEHLLDLESEASANTVAYKHPTTNQLKNSANQQSESVESDTLIDNDKAQISSQNNDWTYHSLDEMDAWLSEPNTSSVDNIIQGAHSKDNTSKGVTPKVHLKAAAQPKTIKENLQDTSEKNLSSSTQQAQEPTTDLSQLLTDMGVPSSDDTNTSHSTQNRSPYSSQAMSAQTQNPAALVLWLSGCLVLVMLLFAQYVIFNLETLIKDPEHAARLQAVCAVAVCSLPRADVTALNITNLNVEPSRIQADNKFSDIEAWLVNQSMQQQLLPTLKVSIYSTDRLIGEFVAMPGDYLASPQNLLTAEQTKPLMFTIPITHERISQVTIDPIY